MVIGEKGADRFRRRLQGLEFRGLVIYRALWVGGLFIRTELRVTVRGVLRDRLDCRFGVLFASHINGTSNTG